MVSPSNNHRYSMGCGAVICNRGELHTESGKDLQAGGVAVGHTGDAKHWRTVNYASRHELKDNEAAVCGGAGFGAS